MKTFREVNKKAKQIDLEISRLKNRVLLLTKRISTVSGASSPTPIAPIPTLQHSQLGGLGKDDHNIYVNLHLPRNIKAVHTFWPHLPGSPFILHANAKNKMVTGLRSEFSDNLYRTITSGLGMSGGGELTDDIDISVKLSSVSGLEFNLVSEGLQLSPSIAGNGIALSIDRVLSVDAAGGLHFTGDILTINRGDGIMLAQTGELTIDVGDGLRLLGGKIEAFLDDGLSFNQGKIRNSFGVLPVSSTPSGALEGNSTSAARADHKHSLITDAPPNPSVNLADSVEGVSNSLSRADHTHKLDIGITPKWTGTHTFANQTEQIRIEHDVTNFATLDVDTGGNLIIEAVGDMILSPEGKDVLPTGDAIVDIGDIHRKWRTIFAAELYAETLVAQEVMATMGGRILVAPTTKLTRYRDDSPPNPFPVSIFTEHNNFRINDYLLMKSAPDGVPQMEVFSVISGPVLQPEGDYIYVVHRNLDGTGFNNWDKGSAVVSLGRDIGEGFIELTSTSTVLNHLGPTMSIYTRTANFSWDMLVPTVTAGNLESLIDYSVPTMGFATGNNLNLNPSTGFRGMTTDATGIRLFNAEIGLFNGPVQTVEILPNGNSWFGTSVTNKTFQILSTSGDVYIADPSDTGGGGAHWDESLNTFNIKGEFIASNSLVKIGTTGFQAKIGIYGIVPPPQSSFLVFDKVLTDPSTALIGGLNFFTGGIFKDNIIGRLEVDKNGTGTGSRIQLEDGDDGRFITFNTGSFLVGWGSGDTPPNDNYAPDGHIRLRSLLFEEYFFANTSTQYIRNTWVDIIELTEEASIVEVVLTTQGINSKNSAQIWYCCKGSGIFPVTIDLQFSRYFNSPAIPQLRHNNSTGYIQFRWNYSTSITNPHIRVRARYL